MSRFSRWISMSVLMLGVGFVGAAAGQAEKEKGQGEGRLKLVETVPRDDLDGVVTPTLSADGKFLYAASWKAASIAVFGRNADSGKLEHKQTIADNEALEGTTGVSISPDGRYAVASAFRSRTAVLFVRNPETGELTRSDVARDGEKNVRYGWPIDAVFAPDSKFVYVLDDNGSGDGGQGAVVAFRVNDGKLELVGIDEGKEGCYAGARGVAFHPDGKTLFVVSNNANTLVVADRDEKTGKTSVRQVVKDEEGDAHGLSGAMGVVMSPDGRDLYVSAGRFQGDDAVSAFRLGSTAGPCSSRSSSTARATSSSSSAETTWRSRRTDGTSTPPPPAPMASPVSGERRPRAS